MVLSPRGLSLQQLAPASPPSAASATSRRLAAGGSQLAHLKSESRREGVRKAAAALATSNQTEELELHGFQELEGLEGGAGSAPRRSGLGVSSGFGQDASDASSEPSPVESAMEFMDRDAELEERALRAESDRDRAYLYKLVDGVIRWLV